MTLEQYKAELAKHDWYYAYSDDHREWKRGHERQKALEAAQPTVDPNKSIWRSFTTAKES